MIFLNHLCYCHLGIPRIVSAKYEVILCLATMVFCQTSIIEKKKRKIKQFHENLTSQKDILFPSSMIEQTQTFNYRIENPNPHL